MSPKKETRKAPKQEAAGGKSGGAFSAEEKEAMKNRARELEAEARGGNLEREVLARIAAMEEPDRSLGRRIHDLVRANAPELAPKLWYGMPAYARNGKVVCFFQDAKKFKARYATIGFSDQAGLDDGNLWPTSFAVTTLTAADEAEIAALVKRAVGRTSG
jgi:uncharacterized protein YdhG (YjbR/CyaY superfamily)